MKQLKITLAEKEITLDFGVMYFLKYLGEYTNGDPFVITMENADNPAKIFHHCAGLLFAGVNAYNKINKLPLITIEDAECFVGQMTNDEAAAFINKYRELNTEKAGEVKPGESPSPGTI